MQTKTEMTFEKEFTDKYLKIKSYDLSPQQERATRIDKIEVIANALVDLNEKGIDCKKYEDKVNSYLDQTLELLKVNEDNYAWAKNFYELETQYIDSVNLFLIRNHGFAQNNYLFNIIAGILIDIPIFIFLVKFPIGTLTMILIKYVYIEIKKRQGKFLY